MPINTPYPRRTSLPNLVDGTDHLDVRAKMGSGTSARELRIGRLDATLTVLPT